MRSSNSSICRDPFSATHARGGRAAPDASGPYRRERKALPARTIAPVAALVVMSVLLLAPASAKRPANNPPAPLYALHVIGRLAGSEASLPQSIDASGDVAGISGGTAYGAATSLYTPSQVPFDSGSAYPASIFLNANGHLRRIPSPWSKYGKLYPVNVVLVNAHRLAAVFVNATLAGAAYYASINGGRVTWRPLNFPGNLAGTANLAALSSVASKGRILGLGIGGGWFPVVWTPDPSGGYTARDVYGKIPLFSDPVPLASDSQFDQVGYWNGGTQQVSSTQAPIVWAGGSKRSYVLSLFPRKGSYFGDGPYADGIALAPGVVRGVEHAYVVGVDQQQRSYITRELLWRVAIRVGRVRRVVWSSRPQVIRGVGSYHEAIVPRREGISEVIGGGVSSTGQVAGAMGWWRERHVQAWCILAPFTVVRWTARRQPYCWSSHDWLHGYVYTNGRTYDLNRVVANRSDWTVEAATSGVPDSQSWSYGSPMNSRGDIMAVGYQDRPNRAMLHACRTKSIWKSRRRLCVLSAMRGPETALLLTPLNKDEASG